MYRFFLLMLFVSSTAHADWSLDYYSFECSSDQASIEVNTYSIMNPSKSDIQSLRDGGNHIVEGRGNMLSCKIGKHLIKANFKYGANSQGQSTGSVTITVDGLPILSRRLFAYYGHTPLVKNFLLNFKHKEKPLKVIAKYYMINVHSKPDYFIEDEIILENDDSQ